VSNINITSYITCGALTIKCSFSENKMEKKTDAAWQDLGET